MGCTRALKSLTLLAVIGLSVVTGHITVLPGGDPKPYIGSNAILSREDFFLQSAERDFVNFNGSIILSSYDSAGFSAKEGLRSSSDSFVRGAIQAWGEHLHLVVRPEEVWFTILTQMNFFMNAHAESLRDLFVSHQGKEVIYIEDWTWEAVIIRFQDEIQKRVKTDWLQDWIMPNFSTTTDSDRMTASVLMMGLTQAYFKFEGGVVCGLPSVTLLGDKSDWEALLAKLDHLSTFGEEPETYAARLRPILTRFVSTFDAPDSPDTIRFWNDIVTARQGTVCGQPPYYISGWITGFHYWDDKGRSFARRNGALRLDNVTYAEVDPRQLPVGYAKVPFTMHDYPSPGLKTEAMLMAGTLGKKVVSGTPGGYAGALQRAGQEEDPVVGGTSVHYTLQPLSGWAVYGPVDTDATVRYVEEWELANLTSSVRANFVEGRCGARL